MKNKNLNCWEYLKCGREPGGKNVEEFGVCPVTQPNQFDGVNKGEHGGRFCWAIAGTLCTGKISGTYAKKLMDCLKCDFLNQVHKEKGRGFVLIPDDVEKK